MKMDSSDIPVQDSDSLEKDCLHQLCDLINLIDDNTLAQVLSEEHETYLTGEYNLEWDGLVGDVQEEGNDAYKEQSPDGEGGTGTLERATHTVCTEHEESSRITGS